MKGMKHFVFSTAPGGFFVILPLPIPYKILLRKV
jgi:hypothetical protein